MVHALTHWSSVSPFDRLKSKRIVAGRNHGKGNGGPVATAVHVARFKPCTKPRIEDVRMSLPELWRKAALNAQMIKLQFDGRRISWKIAAHIIDSHVQASDAATFTLRSNHHSVPASQS
jgi:hypothetical protein